MPVGSYDLTTALSHYLGPTTRDAFMTPRTRGQGMMEKISVDVQDLAALGIPARMREWCREMPIAHWAEALTGIRKLSIFPLFVTTLNPYIYG